MRRNGTARNFDWSDVQRITLIPGDGIGPEVTQSAREVVTAAGAGVA